VARDQTNCFHEPCLLILQTYSDEANPHLLLMRWSCLPTHAPPPSPAPPPRLRALKFTATIASAISRIVFKTLWRCTCAVPDCELAADVLASFVGPFCRVPRGTGASSLLEWTASTAQARHCTSIDLWNRKRHVVGVVTRLTRQLQLHLPLRTSDGATGPALAQ